MTKSSTLTRRGLILAAAAGGVVAVVGLGGGLAYVRHQRSAWRRLNTDPNVFVQITPDDRITIQIKHLEMGQGIMTGLATLVAEEMDADWAQMRAELAPGDQDLFKNGLYGRQATAASSSIHNSWIQMRQIGAAARQMLLQAVADDWRLRPDELSIENGRIRDNTGRETGFGAYADAAAKQQVPDADSLTLKPASAYRLIGQSLPRIDGPDKVTGQAVFSIDVRRPEMLRAVVARSPRFGGRLASYDATGALALPGVREVVEVPSGVAVIADDSWAAMQGRNALRLTWDDSNAETRSSEEMLRSYHAQIDRPQDAITAQEIGAVASGFDAAVTEKSFTFAFPFLAHAPLETLNAVIERDGKDVRVFAGCQLHTLDQWAVAEVFGIDRDRVRIETPFTGSSFGRRAYSKSDWIVELAEVAKASALDRPIQVLWTREDDLRGGVYRPMALHKARVGLDAAGHIVAWEHHVACKSLMKGTPWEVYLLPSGADRGSIGAVTEQPYDFANYRVLSHNMETPIPVGFWRSISDSHGLLATEVIMDEMAEVAGIDPLAFRFQHLPLDAHRERRVLEKVAAMAGWSNRLPATQGRGIALTKDHIIGKTTHVAMIAEVTVADSEINVSRIYVAVDCGLPINPNIIRTQVESSIAFALSTVFRNQITLEAGIIQQENFDLYDPTWLSDMPEIIVETVLSEAAPSGIGEAAVAPVGPAILNAIYQASGRRYYDLPIVPDA